MRVFAGCPGFMVEIARSFLLLYFGSGALAVVAIVVTKSLLFTDIRSLLDRLHPKVGYAFKCTFCFIGWMSFLATVLYRPIFLSTVFSSGSGGIFATLVDGGMSWAVLWWVASQHYATLWPFLEKNAPKMRIAWARH